MHRRSAAARAGPPAAGAPTAAVTQATEDLFKSSGTRPAPIDDPAWTAQARDYVERALSSGLTLSTLLSAALLDSAVSLDPAG